MIRMIQSTSAGHAKSYFTDALLKSDYYVNDQELQGFIRGRLAERLGISGPATKEVFFSLADNRNPVTGKALTPRIKDNRIIGYDINFHCPKSVSVLHALSKDNHILDAFQKAVQATMSDIQADTRTRVRQGGIYNDRTTGELVWADFTHQTARPVEGHLPDPHLHAHCFVFNATWDNKEKKIKAAKFREIKRDMPYYQARFHKRLADSLAGLGYAIKPTDTSFEIDGVPKSIVEHFSKRTDQIGQVAKAKGVVNRKELDALGARTRAKKQSSVSMAELKNHWKKEIKELTATFSIDTSQAIRNGKSKPKTGLKSKDCIEHSLKHCFERASVMDERRFLESCYKHAIGHTGISLDELTNLLRNDDRFIRIRQGSRELYTTHDILSEEKQMVQLARSGIKAVAPLYDTPPDLDLKGQQWQAAVHVLTTKNRTSIIRGAAGAGKTELLKHIRNQIEAAGKQITIVAPSAQASRGILKSEGFKDADTVAKFLIDHHAQESLKGQVLIVDEAGLLGTKDMLRLLEIATKQDARLILCGDTKQHTAVTRGDALRIINTVGNIHAAEVSKIYRQNEVNYKDAVSSLSKGEIKTGFEKLDAMGAIKNINPMHPNEELVKDYIASLKRDKTSLIVSPTHQQGESVTSEVRRQLRALNKLGKKEIIVDKLTNTNFTEAEKIDWRNYKSGHVIQFHQHFKNIKRGSAWLIDDISKNAITIRNDAGEQQNLPIYAPEKFSVFEKSTLFLSKGDKVRITHNGYDQFKKRLDNGTTLDVVSVSKDGSIALQNKTSKSLYHIDKSHGHIAHAHCITSHNSQGKTVDHVFIAQPAATFGATDAKQFYVSVSRARESVRIYTDDREGLLEHASELGDRQSALELVKSAHEKTIILNKQKKYQGKQKVHTSKQISKAIEKEYEPGI